MKKTFFGLRLSKHTFEWWQTRGLCEEQMGHGV